MVARQQETEGVQPRAAAEEIVHFSMDHHSVFLLFSHGFTIEHDKVSIEFVPVYLASSSFQSNISHSQLQHFKKAGISMKERFECLCGEILY